MTNNFFWKFRQKMLSRENPLKSFVITSLKKDSSLNTKVNRKQILKVVLMQQGKVAEQLNVLQLIEKINESLQDPKFARVGTILAKVIHCSPTTNIISFPIPCTYTLFAYRSQKCKASANRIPTGKSCFIGSIIFSYSLVPRGARKAFWTLRDSNPVRSLPSKPSVHHAIALQSTERNIFVARSDGPQCYRKLGQLGKSLKAIKLNQSNLRNLDIYLFVSSLLKKKFRSESWGIGFRQRRCDVMAPTLETELCQRPGIELGSLGSKTIPLTTAPRV